MMAVSDSSAFTHVEEGVIRATFLATAAESDEQWDEMWKELHSLRKFGRVAFDVALRLVNGPYWDRVVGCDLLGVLCDPDDNAWSHEAAEALVTAAKGETDAEVLWSIAYALGNAGDPIGIPVLTALVSSPDPDVRQQVARSFPSCRTFEEGEDTSAIADGMLKLIEDDDSEVRSWATLGLALQLDDDGPDVRAALLRRVEDLDKETRDEAIAGLARRHDRGAFHLLMRALSLPDPNHYCIDAAGYMADQRLLEVLLPLAATLEEGGIEAAQVQWAIERCDPVLGSREVAQLSELFALLDMTSDLAAVSATCPYRDKSSPPDTLVVVEDPESIRYYEFRELASRCHGDMALVMEELISDLD
jgi:HEAT repeat protein